MTLRELSKYYRLCEQLKRSEEALSSLSETVGLGAQKITGMPHAPTARDKVSDFVAEIEDLKAEIERLKMEMDHVERKISSYIETIPDIQTRLIFRLRFLRCMTWPQVADAIGGRNTANSVKLVCHRHLHPKS